MGGVFQAKGFGKGLKLGRKALCATLSFAVLNASLAPVYAMPESLRSCAPPPPGAGNAHESSESG